MNNHPALHLPHQPLPGASRALSQGQASLTGLSLNGVTLFLTGVLVVASGYVSLRPSVGGLSLHPYLIPVAAMCPFVIMARIHLFPTPVLVSLGVFTAMYCFSVFNGGSISLSEIVKSVSAILTIVTTALMVRRRGDFVAGALGLSLAIALLASHGLQEEAGDAGISVMEGANKNSYSLYALPAMLMAGFIGIRMLTVPVLLRGALAALTLPAIVAIFLSANRSGYLGCVVVGLMLFWGRRGRGLLVVGGIALIAMIWVVKFGGTETFDRRMRQTAEGNSSDDYRVEIIKSCAEIALQNPVIGVSPQLLGKELGRITHVAGSHQHNVIDSHNVFGHVAGASGLICFAAMIAIGVTIWNLPVGNGRHRVSKDDPLVEARKLLRMMIVLWVFRGMFTREILYNPACNIALGLAIGLYILAETGRAQQQLADPSLAAGPRHLPTV